jgi:hypothetical protein
MIRPRDATVMVEAASLREKQGECVASAGADRLSGFPHGNLSFTKQV